MNKARLDISISTCFEQRVHLPTYLHLPTNLAYALMMAKTERKADLELRRPGSLGDRDTQSVGQKD